MSRIRFVPTPQLPDGELARHRAYSRGLGLPEIGSAGAVAPRLAVVGGSPRVGQHLDALKVWDGEIWAVNGAFHWCRDHGIEAAFYSIDPKIPASLVEGADRAILSGSVPPATFDALLASGASIELARLGRGEGEHAFACTSAGTAPVLAAARGHRHVTFFGCESSYGAQTHAYKAEKPNLVWVVCGGDEYLTSPQMIMQAEWLAEAARAYPQFITIEGGGFLPALVKHGDYDVTHISPAIQNALKETAA